VLPVLASYSYKHYKYPFYKKRIILPLINNVYINRSLILVVVAQAVIFFIRQEYLARNSTPVGRASAPHIKVALQAALGFLPLARLVKFPSSHRLSVAIFLQNLYFPFSPFTLICYYVKATYKRFVLALYRAIFSNTRTKFLSQ